MFHLNGFHRVWNLPLAQNAMGCGTLGYLKNSLSKIKTIASIINYTPRIGFLLIILFCNIYF
jgi:hypothetical protein